VVSTDRPPVLPKSRDGFYPRCVHCRGENYILAVTAYSARVAPCAAVNGCGRLLPLSYLSDAVSEDNQ
jgi:hypothetical protein